MNNLAEIKDIDYQNIIENIPSIKAKTIIDFVNITSVNRDIINTRNDRNFISNIFASITGKNNREINHLFENMNVQAEAINKFFNYFEECNVYSLKALNNVTDSLIETRKGVMKLQERVYEGFNKIEDNINNLKNELEEKLLHVDLKLEAQVEIEAEFSKLDLDFFKSFSVLERLKIVLENLHFGQTGNLFSIEKDDETYTNNLKTTIKAKTINYLSKTLQKESFNRKDLFEVLKRPDENSLIIKRLFNHSLPIAKGIYDVNLHGYNYFQKQEYDDLPFIFNREILCNRLIDEMDTNRRYFYE